MPEQGPKRDDILNLVQKFGGVGYWDVDIANSRVFWSEKVFEIHGVDPASGEPPLDQAINFYHPDDIGIVQAAVDAASAKGEPFEFQGARIVRPDGTIRYVYSKGEVETDPSGTPVRMFGIFRDITDEVDQTRQLQRANDRLELLAESGAGIWEIDLDAENIFVSKKLSEILGFDAREYWMPLADFIQGIPEEDRSRVTNAIDAHRNGKSSYLLEHRATQKNGNIIWLRSRGQLQRDDKGRGQRIVGWVEDITADRMTDIQNQLIFDSVPVRIWLKDAHNMILRLNQVAAQSMGDTKAAFEGKNTYDLFGDMAKKYHEDDLKVLEAGQPLLGIVEEYSPEDGERGWVQTDKIPIRYGSETFDHLLVVSRDITDIKAVQAALQESEERFRLAADGASVGIWDWVDINGEEEYWSPQFYTLLGYTPEELPASLEAFRSLLHPDDIASTFKAVSGHLENRAPFLIEYRLRHRDKGYRWFLGSGKASFDEDGRPVRMVGSIQDIHDRKIAESELREANAELERFAYIASHDLQEPLRKISQFSELLQIELKEVITEDTRMYIEFLMDAAERMRRQVRALLEYSRAGRSAVRPVVCNIRDMVEKAWTDHSEAPEVSDARLNISGEETLLADPDLLERILDNLIGNAIKYRDVKRELVVEVDLRRTPESSVLTINDNGIGFDPTQKEEIFKLFNRLHRKEEYPGTGLGLAICERVMQLHKGSIAANGRPGEGATFVATFPEAH